MKKLLVIGWDAADWQVIEPLMQEGKMPALQRLVKSGISGNIATLNPPLSPMLWTSIATSKRAYDHGIHGFVEVDHDKGQVKPVQATSRKAPAFWNILNQAGLKTNVINWWPSHPAEKLNGVCVSNALHQKAPAPGEEWLVEKGFVFPENLAETFKKLRLHPSELTLNHIEPFVAAAAELDPEKDKVLKPLMRVLAHCSSVHNAATWCLENTEWDVTAVYYEAIDHFSHLAMKYHPPRQKGIDEKEYQLYKGVVEAAYRFHDMMLERLLDLAGEECHILLVSDHGFQSGKLRAVELPDVSAAPALEHRKYGVFVARGPDFKAGEKVYGTSLLDITPTILHLFDLPVGEDMEGKVRQDLWKHPHEPGSIPGWDAVTDAPQFLETTNFSDKAMLEELREMGYIDLPENDKVKAVKMELDYNLCLSMVDGNRLEQAREKALELYRIYEDGRSAILLSDILLKLGEYDQLAKHLEELRPLNENHPQLIFLGALQHLYTGKIAEAINGFKELENAGAHSVQLYNEIGKAFLLSSKPDKAILYFRKSLTLDNENATALSGSGQCLVESGKYNEAILLLERSLQQLFYQPQVHYLLGVCFEKTGRREEAILALKLCLKQAPKHQKAGPFLQDIIGTEQTTAEEIIIVSGLPRSGTSLMMQMLEAGGLQILSDHSRNKDEHNPAGYLEYEPVKRLGIEAGWISGARGKVLKVISPLLRYLPSSEKYRIIRMQRPLTEVVVSQRVMQGEEKQNIMKNFPFQHAANLQKEEEQTTIWLDQQPNIHVLETEYHDCLENPDEIMEKVASFLKRNIAVQNASDKVNPKLYRNMLGK
ncbi:MAG: alkaline phosphatase family protein [Owenweeksia sp.]